MAYDLKYDKLLRAIERGEQSEAISFFERKLFDVNEGIRYLFEDAKRFVVTPLYWAVRHNCPKVCKYLLSKGARPYGTMVYEYYPLHEACNRGYDKVVQEFVSARCEVDKMNNDSDTPLHIACMRGHIQCVHILLRAGSDCGLRNQLGHTPLQCAVYHDRKDLVELFKAHNKGIETTPPRSSTHQNHGKVSTLAATGVKVQRSQSFNAHDTSTGTEHAERRGTSHLRLRNSPRPQSYYESSGTALVIGQQSLSSLPQSVSLQSLSGNSSYLSSFSTISTHVPPYSRLSPDSPVEVDAPKRSKEPSSQIAKVPPSQTSGEPVCSRMYSKPANDFGMKHSEVSSHSNTVKAGEIEERSVCVSFPSVCPFPSPGVVQKDLPEKKLAIPKHKHPLSASTKSDLHRHGDKALHERMSHPEFHISKRDVHIANRAKSSNDVLLSNSAKRDAVDRAPVLSPTREHINSLATTLCDSLDLHVSLSSHSSLKSSPPLHPLVKSLRISLGSQAHRFGMSPDHHKCLTELSLSPDPPFSQSSFHSLDSASISSLPSFQEVDYDIIEGPLEVEVWAEEGGKEAYATLVYKVQLCDILVQLRSQMNQGDIALLKVRVRLEPKNASPASVPIAPFNEPLPEAAILQSLPHHPNIISVLYYCCGRTEKFRQHSMQQMLSKFHTTGRKMPSLSHSDSSSPNSESCSGTAECLHGTGDSTTYNPASTGIFLFQSLPGISLGKYFRDFLKSEQKEAIIEDKFLHLLAQLLLAVAHLQKNLVSHCAINSQNVYVSDKGERVVLANFGQALNLRPKNLDMLQKSIKRLKTSKTRKLSPEAEQNLAKSNTDEFSTHTLHNLEEAFRMSDSYAVGALFYDLLGKDCGPLSDSETPFIHSLSFRCNHLLQKLVARNPCDRFSALQGAMSCFVLLFGPRTSEICSTTECLRWLASESLELYLNPVLQDSSLPSNRDGNCTRRLHYAYLISANPDLVYNSCKFFSND